MIDDRYRDRIKQAHLLSRIYYILILPHEWFHSQEKKLGLLGIAGYVSGAYMFIFAVFGQSWHRVKNSLLPVSAFATAMLLVSLLHYDRFIHNNPAFALWLIIYIITPFLVPWLWFHNRLTDPGTPELNDKTVPRFARWATGMVGGVTLIFWIVSFIYPPILIAIWPWTLTMLTARVMCSWGFLSSVGCLILLREPRWSAWRYNIQSIALWQALMVIGSILHRQDFTNGSLLNGYFITITLALVLLSFLYAWMELNAPRLIPISKSSETSFLPS